MPRTESETEQLAREAAERVDRDMELGEQLGLLPDLKEPQLPAAQGGQVGRPKGAKNKGSSQMREWLASRGLRMPEEIIAEVAGLRAQGKDAFAFALAQTERLMGHVGETAENRIFVQGKGHVVLPDAWKPSPAEFIDTFRFFYAQARQAAVDLMPYGTPKASPDVSVQQTVQVVVPAAPADRADRADQARDVTPQAPRQRGRMMPADVAYEIEQKQSLSEAPDGQSDEESRTE